jgi:hypothetical protein
MLVDRDLFRHDNSNPHEIKHFGTDMAGWWIYRNSSSPSDRKNSRISGKAHSCARNSVKNEKGRVMVREYFRDIALE